MGRPRIYETPDEMETAIDAYFKRCDNVEIEVLTGPVTNKKITKMKSPETYGTLGLCIDLGICRQTWKNYGDKTEFVDIHKRTMDRIEQNRVDHLERGDGYGPGRIFLLKVHNGYKETSAVEITGKNGAPLQVDDFTNMSNADLIERLAILDRAKAGLS